MTPIETARHLLADASPEKCSKMLPGFFMSDAWRHCTKKVFFIIDGKPYCAQHGKKLMKRELTETGKQ